jgi:hypothetical protein
MVAPFAGHGSILTCAEIVPRIILRLSILAPDAGNLSDMHKVASPRARP